MNLDTDFETDFSTGDINDPRTFEKFLREHGFSRSRAKAITAKGFKGAENFQDREVQELLEHLSERKNKIEIKRGAR